MKVFSNRVTVIKVMNEA